MPALGRGNKAPQENHMGRSIAIFMLAGAVASARVSAQAAVRWHTISFGEPAVSLDTTSVKKSADGYPRATLMLNYAAPRGGAFRQVALKKELADFDCEGRQLRTIQATRFAPSGELIDSLPRNPVPPWVKVTANTHEEAEVVNSFCRTVFAHR
jgi:hypothetical protein